jgi:hypothetical protein
MSILCKCNASPWKMWTVTVPYSTVLVVISTYVKPCLIHKETTIQDADTILNELLKLLTITNLFALSSNVVCMKLLTLHTPMCGSVTYQLADKVF